MQQNKEVSELRADDLTLIDDEKVFLEEQLKYYFEFSDNRWNLNVLESELQVVYLRNTLRITVQLGQSRVESH